jgi:hypothetical protein
MLKTTIINNDNLIIIKKNKSTKNKIIDDNELYKLISDTKELKLNKKNQLK